MNQELPIIILGAGGHAQVLVDLILLSGLKILGFVDPIRHSIESYPQLQYLGNDEEIKKFPTDEINLVNGIGSTSVAGNITRKKLFDKFNNIGYGFATLCHPSAIIASSVVLQEGVQVMAGAIIQANAKIGCNSIVNTKASIDHDCDIGSHVHVAPGVTISGNVRICESSFIGIGTSIIQEIIIDKEIMIKAGSIVTKNELQKI